MQIKVLDIHIGPRFRTDYGKGEMEDLLKSMRENKQITPITVRPPRADELQDGVRETWVLVAGGRRTAGAMMLNWEFIEAYNRDDLDEITAKVLELHENLDRKDMTWDEIAEGKAEILRLRKLQNPNITQREVAIEIGEDPATFSRDIKAAELLEKSPELKKAPSRKAAIRSADMAAHFDSMVAKESSLNVSGAGDVMRANVVTGKAQEWLLTLSPRSVELILTDPPYGIDYFKSGQKMRANSNQAIGISEYDDTAETTRDLLTQVVPLMVRALRPTGWLVSFMNEEMYDFYKQLFLDCCQIHCDYRADGKASLCISAIKEQSYGECKFLQPEPIRWMWHRPNSINKTRYPERHARNVYETILVVNMGFGRIYEPTDNVFVHNAEYGSDRIHVNQKPVPLMVDIIKRLTQQGDMVVDPFFGSGASLAAAASLGRYIAGCDANPNMLASARGLIAKNYNPTPSHGRQMAEKRAEQLLASDEGVYDYSELLE